MATIESVEHGIKVTSAINNAQDSMNCTRTVDHFMELLRTGQLQKGQHDGLVDRFVNWVQQDPIWDLGKNMAPEFRANKVLQEFLTDFPNGNIERLYHVQDVLDKLQERIHRPLTAEQIKEREEWKKLCQRSGVTVVGSPEWYDKIAKEQGHEWADQLKARSATGTQAPVGANDREGEDSWAGLTGMGIVVGQPTTLGEAIRAGAAAKEKSDCEKEEKK